jgi:hypothetical protein
MNHSGRARSTPAACGGLGMMLLLTACPGAGGRDDGPVNTGIDSLGTDGTAGTAGTADTADADTTAGTMGTAGTADTDPSADTTDTNGAELQFIQVDPQNAVLEVDLGTPGSLEYTVTGYFTDGSQLDVTDQVDSWVVSNPAVGAMNGTTFETPPFGMTFFGTTLVTATVGDEVGVAQLTVAAYRQTGEQQDFFFVLPYDDPAGPQEKPLTFSTDVKALDVFFNMDTTGSMGGPIGNLQSSLVSTVIPGIEAQIPNTYFGVGAFEDFPIAPFGEQVCNYFGPSAPDQPFQLLREMTNVVADVQAAVNQLSLPNGWPIGCGNDTPESNIESLYQIATGEGIAGPGVTNVPANVSGVGGVGFREGAMPVIVSITDAISHENAANPCLGASYTGNAGVAAVAHNRSNMFAALGEICARVVPVVVSNFAASCSPLSDGNEFATQTGAIIPPDAWDLAPGGRPPGCGAGQCCTGINGAGVAPNGMGLCPLTYRVNSNGSGLGQSIVDGVQMLAAYSPFDVTTQVDGMDTDVDGVALPPGTTTADFIVSVVPFSHGPIPLPGVPPPTLTDVAFLDVIPDTDVTFTVTAYNDFVPQGPSARLFTASITVLADGCSDLDTREVLILVPPQALPPPG